MTTELVRIHNTDIQSIEHNGQRVITLAQMDEVHERRSGAARNSFHRYKERLTEGKHYFVKSFTEAASIGITAPNGLILLTEKGYFVLVKSFRDDLAWEVQEALVDGYFRTAVVLPPKPRPEITDPHLRKAMEILRTNDEMVELFGIPKHVALVEQTKLAKRETGLDFSNYLQHSRYMDDIEPSEVMLEPTELGRYFGVGGQEMNKRLEAMMLQSKVNSQWVANDRALGTGLATIHHWQSGSKSGYNLKWKLSAVKELMQQGLRAIEGGSTS